MSRFDLRRLRSRNELVLVSRELAAQVRADDLPTLAAAVAFKIVLALLPSLLAAIAIFSLVTDPSDLSLLLERLPVPAPVTEFLEPQLWRLIDNRLAGVALASGVVVGAWAASGAAVTLNRSLTRASERVDSRRLVRARIDALMVTVALLLALVGIFVLVVVGGRIEDRVLDALPLTTEARDLFDVIAMIARYVLSAIALMLLFAFIYWVGPDYDQRPPYPWISPGAVLGVVGWLVVSALFGLYTSTFGGIGAASVYGPLGSVVVFMLWLQLSLLTLLFGAEVNQVLERRAVDRISAAEVAGFGGDLAAQPGMAAAAQDGPPPASAAQGAHRSETGARDGAGAQPGAGDRALDGTDGPRPRVTGRDVRDHGVPSE